MPSEQSSILISQWGNTFGQKYFERTGKQTTNLASINKTVLSEFPVPVIPAKEQQEVGQVLDEKLFVINQMQADLDHELAQADILRQSILKKAFPGQLIPQDPNDEPASVLLERIKAKGGGNNA